MNRSYVVIALLILASAAFPAGAASVVVPGTSDPWLAGMPHGSTASGGDVAPGQAPVLVTGMVLVPGAALQFSASGAVAHGEFALVGPDGDPGLFTPHFAGAENGISNVNAPVDSLLGLFLDANPPFLSAAPAMLDFGAGGNVVGGIDYPVLTPVLKQVFFIGDGLTGGGLQQQVIVPSGATRLYLGTMDGTGWFNNVGSFTVEVSAIPEPETYALLLGGLGLLGFAARRRVLGRCV